MSLIAFAVNDHGEKLYVRQFGVQDKQQDILTFRKRDAMMFESNSVQGAIAIMTGYEIEELTTDGEKQ